MTRLVSQPQIYLDYSATTPVDNRVLEKMLPWFTQSFGNASSSSHTFGWQAAEIVKLSREFLAETLGAHPKEILFTSGATESINLAIKGVAKLYGRRGKHFVTLQTEHKAVLDSFAYLEKNGFEVTYLPVDTSGLVELDTLEKAIRDDTVMVSIMLVNNETGVIQPLKTISEIVHRKGAIMMSDITQAFGKMNIQADELGLDVMAFSAHKMYGPKGTGGLYLRKRSPRVVVEPFFHGGNHENGFRSGTLNVPGIVGMAEAVKICLENLSSDREHIHALRNRLESQLIKKNLARLNGHPEHRLYNISNLSFLHHKGKSLIKSLNKIAVSQGSACTSASPAPSHVLSAMGLEKEEAYASIRFSLGRYTTETEIEFTIKYIQTQLEALKTDN